MAGFQDGHKLKGRFIKRDSKVLEHVALADFRFDEISEAPTVAHDNTDASIIHAKYHTIEDLDEGVKTPESFDQSLLNESHSRPILRPLDFTNAWHRDLKRQKERDTRHHTDDGLYDDYDPAFQDEIYEQNEPASFDQDDKDYDEEESAQAHASRASEQEEDDSTSPRSEFESVDFAGKVIKRLHEEDAADESIEQSMQDTADVQVAENLATQKMEAAIEQSVGDETETAEGADEFIPSQGTAGVEPEKAAADEYKQRLHNLQASQAAAMDEAKAQGYEEGFRLGEEKAQLQARAQAQAIFGKLTELFEEFGSLKKEVLSNVQQNFFEISQAIAESLLKREFEINPGAFASVVRRAIDESVSSDKFKVRVNPQTFARLKTLSDESMLTHLIGDESVNEGDFKIESDLSVVDGSIGKLVRELLEKADLALFDEDQTDKAG